MKRFSVLLSIVGYLLVALMSAIAVGCSGGYPGGGGNEGGGVVTGTSGTTATSGTLSSSSSSTSNSSSSSTSSVSSTSFTNCGGTNQPPCIPALSALK